MARFDETGKAKHKDKVCLKCGAISEGFTLCLKHRIKYNVMHNKRRKRLRDANLCTECKQPMDRVGAFCTKCLAINAAYNVNARKSIKDEVFKAYGGYKCNCCGNTEEWAQTIDHVNNDGADHRRKSGEGGGKIHRWLKANNYPSNFQVLCANCQLGKLKNNGICPHKTNNVIGNT